MDNHCPFITGCPIFAYFNETAKGYFVALYCQGSYTRCQRRQLRILGKPVPPDLLPSGGSLKDIANRSLTRTIL